MLDKEGGEHKGVAGAGGQSGRGQAPEPGPTSSSPGGELSTMRCDAMRCAARWDGMDGTVAEAWRGDGGRGLDWDGNGDGDGDGDWDWDWDGETQAQAQTRVGYPITDDAGRPRLVWRKDSTR